ncbi:MAG: M48 family metallopeptidase [Lacipirellulaceae bacterium]
MDPQAERRYGDPYGGRVPGGYGQGNRPMFGVGRPQAEAGYRGQAGGGMGGLKIRLLIALALAAFALFSYYANPGDPNQITGNSERVAMVEEEQEMALGRQAAPEMAQQHGGESDNEVGRNQVAQVGRQLLGAVDVWIANKEQELSQRTGKDVELRNPYQFEFTLLADDQTVNAFALPGGQVFITEALYDRLDTVGQLAGVLGHEVGHVLERHGNKRMAKQQLFSGLAAAGGVAGGDANSARISQMVTQFLSMKYGREDELESDGWGVELCALAGFDPRAMIGVMKVLDEASPGGGPPEMMSTHPKPANRMKYIQEVLQQKFPNGVPAGLEP